MESHERKLVSETACGPFEGSPARDVRSHMIPELIEYVVQYSAAKDE